MRHPHQIGSTYRKIGISDSAPKRTGKSPEFALPIVVDVSLGLYLSLADFKKLEARREDQLQPNGDPHRIVCCDPSRRSNSINRRRRRLSRGKVLQRGKLRRQMLRQVRPRGSQSLKVYGGRSRALVTVITATTLGSFTGTRPFANRISSLRASISAAPTPPIPGPKVPSSWNSIPARAIRFAERHARDNRDHPPRPRRAHHTSGCFCLSF